MEEPWEALDIDDSDIPSLLRPCKLSNHREATTSTTTTTALPEPLLRPCSHPASKALTDEEKQEQRRIIPGPAGAVQSAMLQKTRDREKFHFGSQNQGAHFNPISTQEYIRRAVENAPEFDDDFNSKPWLSALQFIGTVDGVVPSIPLSSINQCVNVGKVDKVVAVIKSCTHNILGGLMVTLKDPTGTIGASVHHKVLSESQFAQDFVVGSVLILEKAAIFSPSKSVHYLNIMPRNLVKVFEKDNGPPTKRHDHAYFVKYVAPGEECFGKVGSPTKMFTPENGTSEEILVGGMQHPTDRRGRLDGNNQSEKGDLLPLSLTGSSRCSLKHNIEDKEPSILQQYAEKGLFEERLPENVDDEEQAILHDNDRVPKTGNTKERLLSDDAAESMMKNPVDVVQEIQEEDNRKQKQKQLFTSSLPQWTDEQLKELFAGQDEDDDSFF